MAQLKDTTVNGTLTAGNIEIKEALAIDGVDAETKFNLADTLDSKLTKIFGTAYNLSCTTTAGSNYTVNSASCYLIGNLLRVYFYVTRSSSASGNITNEDVLTFKVNTGGKIGAIFNSSWPSSNSGAAAAFYTTGESVSGNTLTFTVRATSYAHSTSSPNGFCMMTARIIPSAY